MEKLNPEEYTKRQRAAYELLCQMTTDEKGMILALFCLKCYEHIGLGGDDEHICGSDKDPLDIVRTSE